MQKFKTRRIVVLNTAFLEEIEASVAKAQAPAPFSADNAMQAIGGRGTLAAMRTSFEKLEEKQAARLKEWQEEGQSTVETLDRLVSTAPQEVKQNLQSKLVGLSETIGREAESRTLGYRSFIVRMEKLIPAFTKESKTGGQILRKFIKRIENLLFEEIETLTLHSDHYRGLAVLSDPEPEISDAFGDAGSLMARLQSN